MVEEAIEALMRTLIIVRLPDGSRRRVQFLGGSLRCLSAASTHANYYRCASVMLQHSNSLLSSRRVFHAETVPSRANSPSIKQGPTAMTAFAFSRKWLRIRLGGWALGTSDRGGQDKSRKVRTVGWVRNSAKSRLFANIARVSRNLPISASR